ncbi:hypothetical protein BGZ60DRAFT_534203 [Tricladium varicosporioides]|nr:hypothetical protein BGZ60DRAFT_534203 [Hymenoscyphus varicosporioides]
MDSKRQLNANALERNGISYFKKASLDRLSPQALLVAEGLLDFESILSHKNFEKLSYKSQQEINKSYLLYKIPEPNKRSSVEMDSYEEEYQVTAHEARFDLALKISKASKDIVSAKEARWSAVVKNELFGNLIRSSRQEEGARLLDPKKHVEKIRVEEEDQWEHGHKSLERTTPVTAAILTAPKPDLYIALPIFSKVSYAIGFYKDDYIQNFTQDNLTKLEEPEHGNLISNPITPMDTLKVIEEKHLVCFPSTVVEIKHHKVKKSEIRHCYHQAANAAATSLSMLGRLSHVSIPNSAVGEMQPVVAFTFIGSKFRVWVAYISYKNVKLNANKMLFEYQMCCIFKGDLLSVWDTVRLCRIIENVHYWTVSHFRPWVSSCISRWKWAAREANDDNSTWIGRMADLRGQDSRLNSDDVQSLEGDSSENYDEETEDDDNLEYVPSDKEESSSGNEESEIEGEESEIEGEGSGIEGEESEIEKEEEIEEVIIPSVRTSQFRQRNAGQVQTQEHYNKRTSRTPKTTPTRVRNAKTVSPEFHGKTRRSIFPSDQDLLALPIVGGKKHVRARSSG